jgi:hypothetical protein
MSEDTTRIFDTYDRQIGALKGLPDVIEVKPSTVRVSIPLLGLSLRHLSCRRFGNVAWAITYSSKRSRVMGRFVSYCRLR